MNNNLPPRDSFVRTQYNMTGAQPRYAIIGGGISGLSAAYYLQKQIPDAAITVFESGERLGGVLKTIRTGSFLIETSADMFVTQPSDAFELCRDLGIENELIATLPVQDRAFIGLGDTIFPVPQGLSMMVPTRRQPILDSALLTKHGKSRFLGETEIEALPNPKDESLKSFAIRRFGIEAYEKIIQPMVSGIYTADPAKLSMNATMQRFVDMERQHGSLIAAMQNNRNQGDSQASGARYAMFRAPSGGMSTLVTALIQALPKIDVKTNTLVTNVSARSATSPGNRWAVDGRPFDGIILATPAAASASMIGETDPTLADALSGITTASSAIVVLAIARSQLKTNFRGFGIIYPHIDGGQVIALSFSSNKFAGRCEEDEVLIRCFIGGALQSDLVDLPDNKLIEIAIAQLNRSIGLAGEPIFTAVFRWKQCMPQYHLGHLSRVQQIEQQTERHYGLEIAGNSYRGVGIPACIASGKSAADRMLKASN